MPSHRWLSVSLSDCFGMATILMTFSATFTPSFSLRKLETEQEDIVCREFYNPVKALDQHLRLPALQALMRLRKQLNISCFIGPAMKDNFITLDGRNLLARTPSSTYKHADILPLVTSK